MAQTNKALTGMLSKLRKKIDSFSSDESDICKIKGYIDTGSYAINRVISGSIYLGVPEGRIVTFAGDSGTGKSFIVAKIIKNALSLNKYDVVFYIDSEGGGLWAMLQGDQVDLSKIEHVPVCSTEECSVALLNIYDSIAETHKEQVKAGEPLLKALVVIDSLGGLVADKVINDAVNKTQMVQDMGTGARLKNTMVKSLMMRVVKTNASCIILNHVYDNPAAMFASKIKDMPGGKGLEYASHIIVQTARKLIKEGDDDIGKGVNDPDTDQSSYYKGTTLKFFTVKNRIIKPGYEATVYIDFDHGVSKWDGLVDEARKMGFIQGGTAGKYEVPTYSDKKLTLKQILSNDDIWATFLEEFNKKSMEDVSYKTKMNIEDELSSIDEDTESASNVK